MSDNSALAPTKPAAAQLYVRQVREIAKLISKGRWLPGITELDYMAKHRLSKEAVRQRAAEARRLVQESFGDLADLRTDVAAQLAGIAAETRKKEPRTAVAALQVIAQVTGLITKHTIHHDAGMRDLTPEQKRLEIARIRGQLDDAERALDALPGPAIVENANTETFVSGFLDVSVAPDPAVKENPDPDD